MTYTVRVKPFTLGEEKKRAPVPVRDLNRTGVGFLSKEKLKKGQSLVMNLVLGPREPAVAVMGEVRRVEPGTGRYPFRIGAGFTDVSNETWKRLCTIHERVKQKDDGWRQWSLRGEDGTRSRAMPYQESVSDAFAPKDRVPPTGPAEAGRSIDHDGAGERPPAPEDSGADGAGTAGEPRRELRLRTIDIFLQGKSNEDIAQSTSQDLRAVDTDVNTFVRVGLLANRQCSDEEIAIILNKSLPLVRAYRQMYQDKRWDARVQQRIEHVLNSLPEDDTHRPEEA